MDFCLRFLCFRVQSCSGFRVLWLASFATLGIRYMVKFEVQDSPFLQLVTSGRFRVDAGAEGGCEEHPGAGRTGYQIAASQSRAQDTFSSPRCPA